MRSKAAASGYRYKDWTAFFRNWLVQAARFQSERTGKAMPAIPRWADCAPPEGNGSLLDAGHPSMALVRRKALASQWLGDTSMRLPPRPGWLERGLVVPEAQQIADLDAWLRRAADMNQRTLPPLDPPLQQAAE